MRFRVESAELFLSDCRVRLPFRFGVVTLTEAPTCVARVRAVAEDGTEALGYSADLLVPKWFDKDPAKSLQQNSEELLESARNAARVYAQGEDASVFDHWWRTWNELDAGADLVRGFGVALCERALMDAACRATGVSFFDALKRDLFSIRPGDVHTELEGWDLARSLPASPTDRIAVRHTVGLADILRAADVPDADREDGLPYSLEEDVQRYGFTHFKLKLCGDREQDIARLIEVAGVLGHAGRTQPRVTVDGNEQFTDLAELVDLFEELERHPSAKRLLAGLLYIEQPLARAISFDAGRTRAMGALSQFGPVVLDEADAGLDSLERGLLLGYRGISVKNCKGVFRALLARGLCEKFGNGAFQCSEDLTNLPVLALQQDLATLAALGLEHTERNGHHYFRGLDLLPAEEASEAMREHSDLYRQTTAGRDLAIEDGVLSFASIHRPGYGHSVNILTGERTPAAAWTSEKA